MQSGTDCHHPYFNFDIVLTRLDLPTGKQKTDFSDVLGPTMK